MKESKVMEAMEENGREISAGKEGCEDCGCECCDTPSCECC